MTIRYTEWIWYGQPINNNLFSLSQRLNKLSVIRYASQESGLNRKVAPTTNKHTIEGSNPAYTEEKVNKIKDFDDTASIDSGDSDLVGIENNPEFEVCWILALIPIQNILLFKISFYSLKLKDSKHWLNMLSIIYLNHKL